MPQILVIADDAVGDGQTPVMFRERVSVNDFESDHFASQLVERLGWAVGDADELNQRSRSTSGPRRVLPATDVPAAGRRAQRAPRSASVVTTAS